jgi:sugar phosphate isomerase/epimerase
VVEAIQQVIPIAGEFGLKQDVLLEIVEAIDERQHFGIQYDPSNVIIAGDDPIALLKRIRHRVVSIH